VVQNIENGATGTTIKVGDGFNDRVNINGGGNIITVGNGNNDTVSSTGGNTIAVGNGNDTIHVGTNDTVTIGSGHDTLAFDQNPATTGGDDQTMPGGIGAVTITGFNPSKDVIDIQNLLATTFRQNHPGGRPFVCS
jgi:Ca2+-binding RTX toxin-like protein